VRRALVLGGYGGFGGRIAVRLAREGFEVVVAGRSLLKAQAFCATHPDARLTPAAVDRAAPLGPVLARLRPWLVVDAAGPFQGADYAVPRACIAVGAHYLDIADGRAFVAGIDPLDAEAVAAGVAVVSGASTVPALSSAVVDALAAGLERVTLIEAALTASHRATGGAAVVEAILSYAGRPVELRQAGRRFLRPGWSDLAWRRLSVAGGPSLPPRLVALCDVPDLELLGDRCPGRPLVVFRAGAEFAVLNLALWALSFSVRWGWVRDLRGLAPPMAGVLRATRGLGGDRSGMEVRVLGLLDGRPVERRWTLIAERGDGPQTPCLAAPLLARKLADGALSPGARPAVGLLSLAEFEASFAGLAFSTGVETLASPPPRSARGATRGRRPYRATSRRTWPDRV